MNVLRYSTPSGQRKWMVEFVYEGVRHRKRGFEKKVKPYVGKIWNGRARGLVD